MPNLASAKRDFSDVIQLDVSIEAGAWPIETVLRKLCETAIEACLAETGLEAAGNQSELSLLFTDDAHIRLLNTQWRGKNKATNVLSFPAFPPDKKQLPPMLGDIVLASETVRKEALAEQKPLEHHISHLTVHGFLHLLGYDHENANEAEAMEALERRILARLAIPDPYA